MYLSDSMSWFYSIIILSLHSCKEEYNELNISISTFWKYSVEGAQANVMGARGAQCSVDIMCRICEVGDNCILCVLCMLYILFVN